MRPLPPQVRVYTKPKGKLPDFNEPVVLRRSQCSIEGFCNKLHKTMVKQVRGRGVRGSIVMCRRSRAAASLWPPTHPLPPPPPPLPPSTHTRTHTQTHTHTHTHAQTQTHAHTHTAALQMKYALVWGTSAKHRPQKVGKDHVLGDEDIVQIVKKI